jgi:pyridinium-3,5-biscarboxylic acid mononucleotide synthase
MTSNKQLHDLLDQVARGEVDTGTAHARLMDELRARPYEDLGFARVDLHRSVRQGFPEVILGLGANRGHRRGDRPARIDAARDPGER